MKKQLEIPILSFFTGGGFLDIGFEDAGFKVVWSNEVNPDFVRLYASGMTAWKKSSGDVRGFSIRNSKSIENVFAPEILKDAFPSGRPDIFGVIGGPPCPDFSVGGKNKGGSGRHGKLSKTFVERICKLKPTFFVFENVTGLFRTHIHREYLAGLERKLEKHGYCLDLKIISALELGVPQDRERLIMVGIKKSLVGECKGVRIKEKQRNWFTWPDPKYKGAKADYTWPDIVNGMPPKKPAGIPDELTVNYCFDFSKTPGLKNCQDVFKAYSDKFYKIKEGDTGRKSFKRLHRYRFSPTVCYGHNEVHLHPWEPRRLSVREAMRIQGVPDEYALPEDDSLTAKFAMISNGVPVPLAREVAKSLMAFLKRGVENGRS
jgi:DNA (cytosine-5)-methyltransferase 1